VTIATRPTRAELYALYAPLRNEGYTVAEIAARYGKARSSVHAILDDPDGSKQRARRRRYQGTCATCGARTDGSNGSAKAPRYCATCFPLSPEFAAQKAAQTYWTRELLIERIQEWAELYGEPPAIPDWSPSQARCNHDEPRARRFEDARPHWPWFTSVVRVFGSWRAGLEAAGFEARAPHGGGGNVLRRRSQRARALEEVA